MYVIIMWVFSLTFYKNFALHVAIQSCSSEYSHVHKFLLKGTRGYLFVVLFGHMITLLFAQTVAFLI